MPLSNLLRTAADICRYCGNKAGALTRDHPECRRTFDVGWNRMVGLAAEAAKPHQFDEKSLRLSLAEIASTSYGDGATVNETLEEGWKRGVAHAMPDGILARPRKPDSGSSATGSLDSATADPKAAAQLVRAATDRFMPDARLAAVAVDDPHTHLRELSESLRQAGLGPSDSAALLATARDAAVESALEDGLLTLDEENALNRYIHGPFRLRQSQMNQNGVLP